MAILIPVAKGNSVGRETVLNSQVYVLQSLKAQLFTSYGQKKTVGHKSDGQDVVYKVLYEQHCLEWGRNHEAGKAGT